MLDMEDVIREFRRRWEGLGIGVPCDALVARYGEAGRSYHDARHVVACLEELDGYRVAGGRVTQAMELAVFFHDAVYDPRRSDNEEMSARLAEELLGAVASPEESATVRRLILATAHKRVPVEDDERVVVNVDLAILGKGETEFGVYERGIRAEYAFVPEDQFRAGRAAVLRGFLKRERIYSTEYFWKKYESAARENLGRMVAGLEHA